MGTIRASSRGVEFDIATHVGETALEALRRRALPVQDFVLVDRMRRFVSLAHIIEPDETIHAYPVRSVDDLPLTPDVAIARRPAAIAEIFAASGESQAPGIVQFTRAEAIDYVYDGFKAVLDGYRRAHPDCPPIQIAFTSGDSSNRVVGECIGRYQDDHPEIAFHAVIT
jgi:hypothetical protein